MEDGQQYVLVTGDRKWINIEVIHHVLSTLHPSTTIVHGFAHGVDSIADEVAKVLKLTVIRCPAHWSHDTPKWIQCYGPCQPDCQEIVGKAAGIIRNRKMLDSFNPHLVIGFHSHIFASRGTRDMLNYSWKRGVTRRLFNEMDEEIQLPDGLIPYTP